MKRTKLIALALVCALLLGLACAAKADDKIDVTVAIWDADIGLQDPNDPILTILEEKTGVHLIPQNVTWDDADQKIQLWSTSGQLPDIFAGGFVDTSFFHKWVNQGVVRALPDDLSAYPNLSEYLKMDRAQAAMVDGKYYMIPRQTFGDITYSVLDRNIAYRWDLAQAVGVTEEPTTWEEFCDMVKKIIEADPQGKSISGLTAAQTAMVSGFVLPYGGIVQTKWVHDGEKFLPSYFAGDLKAAMEFGRKLYTDGILEPDIALTKIDTAKEKFLQGQSVGLIFGGAGPHWLYNSFEKDWQELYGHSMLDDIKIAHIFPGYDGKKYYFVDTEAWSESYFSYNVDDEKMAAICKLYDYLLSDEGRTLMACGIEGEDYDVVDGQIVMKEGVNLNDKYQFFAEGNSVPSLATWPAVSWDPSIPSDIPMSFRELNEARHQEAVDEGTLPKYYDAVLFLSTPLKDTFAINSGDDVLAIIAGADPVDQMVDELMAGYEAKGLWQMIDEVTAAAAEAGIEP